MLRLFDQIREGRWWRIGFYSWHLLDDAILFYPVYTVYFSRSGIDAAGISLLLIIWSLSAALLQIPTGWLADVFPRAAILSVGAALRGVGFLIWILYPTFIGFTIGFLFWAIKSALTSGSIHAMAFDALTSEDRSDLYGRTMSRGATLKACGGLASIGAAALIVSLGGIELVAIGSFAVCVLQASMALTLPWVRSSPLIHLRTLISDGFRESWRNRTLRAFYLFIAPAVALLGIDEYYGLTVQEKLTSNYASLSLLALLPAILGIATTAILGARKRTPSLGVLLLPCVLLLFTGSLAGGFVGVLLVAGSIGAFQAVQVGLDADMQRVTPSRGRATLTSMRQLSTEVGTLSMYGLIAVATGLGVSTSGALAIIAAIGIALATVLLLRQRGPSIAPDSAP